MDGNWIPIVAIIGGLSLAAYNQYLRMKAKQLMHQERLAMIERGLTPPPMEAMPEDWPKRKRSSRPVGVILVALGLGLPFLIFFEADESLGEAVSIGALFFFLGAGFLVNAMLDRRAETPKLQADQKEPR